jgi:hypothetical protein
MEGPHRATIHRTTPRRHPTATSRTARHTRLRPFSRTRLSPFPPPRQGGRKHPAALYPTPCSAAIDCGGISSCAAGVHRASSASPPPRHRTGPISRRCRRYFTAGDDHRWDITASSNARLSSPWLGRFSFREARSRDRQLGVDRCPARIGRAPSCSTNSVGLGAQGGSTLASVTSTACPGQAVPIASAACPGVGARRPRPSRAVSDDNWPPPQSR